MMKLNERMEELLSMGLSKVEAIELIIVEANEEKVKKMKSTKWVYKGDIKCPICSRYSKMYTTGTCTNPTMKITCKSHGILIKVPNGVWKQES